MNGRTLPQPTQTGSARRTLPALALGCLLAWPTAARAEGPQRDPAAPMTLGVSLDELTGMQAQLALASSERRDEALHELSNLGDPDLPAIRARLRALSREKADHKAWLAKLPLLQATHGSDPKATRDDREVGLSTALERDRSAAMLRVVELFALLSALEGQQSLAASELIVNELFSLEPRLFRAELAPVRKRLGKLLVPGYLRARAQGELALQKLARDGLAALGVADDASLFGQGNAELLAASIDVESEVGRTQALPWFVALLGDARPAVRGAARRAMRAHAQGAQDALRQRHADLIGEEPDPSLGPDKVLERVLAQLDVDLDRDALQALQLAQTSLRAGDLEAATHQLDAALEHGGSAHARALAAASYVELSDRRDLLDQAAPALVAARRALRLAAEGSEDQKRARARVLYLESERRAGRGIADVQSLQAAVALQPSHPRAEGLLQELRGTRVDREREQRKWLGLLAAASLAVAATLVLHIRRQLRREREALLR